MFDRCAAKCSETAFLWSHPGKCTHGRGCDSQPTKDVWPTSFVWELDLTILLIITFNTSFELLHASWLGNYVSLLKALHIYYIYVSYDYFNFDHTFRDFKNNINNFDDKKDLSFVKQFINLHIFEDVLKTSVFAIGKLERYCKIIYG